MDQSAKSLDKSLFLVILIHFDIHIVPQSSSSTRSYSVYDTPLQ